MFDKKLQDEYGRLSALRRYEVLDTPPDAPFEKVTSLVQMILDVPISAVSLVDKDRQWFKSCVGLDVRETARDISFCTHAIGGRQPMAIEDTLLDDRFSTNPLVTDKPFIRSYIGVPLETPDGYNIGSLCALDAKPRIFSDGQIKILKSFAALVVDELELLSLARTDQLTGATSRRAFMENIQKAATYYARRGVASSLCLFDLDHFKYVNDTFGHPAGDQVLRAVGQCCAALTRSADTFGRFGGEEFGLLQPNTDLEGAMLTAERFRAALAEMVVPHEPPLRITASFGIATFSSTCRTADNIIAGADRGLYLAKHSGRNCCRALPVDPV